MLQNLQVKICKNSLALIWKGFKMIVKGLILFRRLCNIKILSHLHLNAQWQILKLRECWRETMSVQTSQYLLKQWAKPHYKMLNAKIHSCCLATRVLRCLVIKNFQSSSNKGINRLISRFFKVIHLVKIGIQANNKTNHF